MKGKLVHFDTLSSEHGVGSKETAEKIGKVERSHPGMVMVRCYSTAFLQARGQRKYWVFQQESALVHEAKSTQPWLEANLHKRELIEKLYKCRYYI
ncbi:hypothetical protein Trydic_g9638 [Trypoxylus dichotomus]